MSAYFTDTAPFQLKSAYATSMQWVKKVLSRLGLLGTLDRWATRSKWAHYLRSFLAIHQLEDMIALDVPWWTYSAMAYVEKYLAANPGARVLEYGSGASTLWFVQRGATVVSIEHDADWYSLLLEQIELRPAIRSKVTLILDPPVASRMSKTTRRFDALVKVLATMFTWPKIKTHPST